MIGTVLFVAPFVVAAGVLGALWVEKKWRRKIENSDMGDVPMIMCGRAYFVSYIGDGEHVDSIRYRKAMERCEELYTERPPRLEDYPWANAMGCDVVVTHIGGARVKRPGAIYVKCSAGCRWDNFPAQQSVLGDRFYIHELETHRRCPICKRTDRFEDHDCEADEVDEWDESDELDDFELQCDVDVEGCR